MDRYASFTPPVMSSLQQQILVYLGPCGYALYFLWGWCRKGKFLVYSGALTWAGLESLLLHFQNFCELNFKHRHYLKIKLHKLQVNYVKNKGNKYPKFITYWLFFCNLLCSLCTYYHYLLLGYLHLLYLFGGNTITVWYCLSLPSSALVAPRLQSVMVGVFTSQKLEPTTNQDLI